MDENIIEFQPKTSTSRLSISDFPDNKFFDNPASRLYFDLVNRTEDWYDDNMSPNENGVKKMRWDRMANNMYPQGYDGGHKQATTENSVQKIA